MTCSTNLSIRPTATRENNWPPLPIHGLIGAFPAFQQPIREVEVAARPRFKVATQSCRPSLPNPSTANLLLCWTCHGPKIEAMNRPLRGADEDRPIIRTLLGEPPARFSQLFPYSYGG